MLLQWSNTVRAHDKSIIKGALTGALAGLAASYVMDRFQELVGKLLPQSGGSEEDPSTVKVAERIAGHELPKDEKASAGDRVHYSFGAFLGVIYGIGAELVPMTRTGFGVPYGLTVAAIADEVVVPALGLSGLPWKSPASTHAYSVASHIVFGVALEGVRRLLRIV